MVGRRRALRPRRAAKRTRPNGLSKYVTIFSALGEPVRLEMIRMISETDELACTTLADRLPISKSTISYHVKILYHAGLISVRKDGRNYHYKVLRDVLDKLVPGFLPRVAARHPVEAARGPHHRAAIA